MSEARDYKWPTDFDRDDWPALVALDAARAIKAIADAGSLHGHPEVEKALRHFGEEGWWGPSDTLRPYAHPSAEEMAAFKTSRS